MKFEDIYLPIWYTVDTVEEGEKKRYELVKWSKLRLNDTGVLWQNIQDQPNSLRVEISETELKVAKIMIFWEWYKPVIVLDIDNDTEIPSSKLSYWKKPYSQEEWEIKINWSEVDTKHNISLEDIKQAIETGKDIVRKLLKEDIYIKEWTLKNLDRLESLIKENTKKES